MSLEKALQLVTVPVEIPAGCNIIVGHSHFIKTAEDLYEALVNSSPQLRFGVAFCEASEDRLVRVEGNDPELSAAAARNAERIGAGHTFVIVLREGFPINVLPALRQAPELCRIFCATANPLEMIVVVTEQGRGVLGVIDGFTPLGVEDDSQRDERRAFLRKIGYKL